MAEMKESRDAATTTETPSALGSPHSPSTPRRTSVPLYPHKSPLFHVHPHSPTLSYGRPRSHSLGGSGYNVPLLVPQSPPPFAKLGGGSSNASRSLSLSPNLNLHRPTAPPGGRRSVPFLNTNEPPRINDTQKAMETAVMAERKRFKEMEAQEKDLTADEVRAVLKRERHRMSKYASDLAKLKSAAVQCQAEAEVLEEGRINGLMRRLDTLQVEKGRIINELEREEELLTNTLQKKLNEVRREKAQLEKMIEHEQLAHSDLHTTLIDLRDPTQTNNEQVASKENTLGKPLAALGPLTEGADEEEEEEEGEIEEDSIMQS